MLYNKYRPKNFRDIVGQEYITNIIKNQVMQDKMPHAYLFCGTRGTGKTTTAKVLAKAVNCPNAKDGEPCNECDICKKIDSTIFTDLLEVDAASNRKIDDIRNIISQLQYPPSEGKYRVIILDEAHMLTNEAVNAFLKTLEEPPSNVIFILATTDPQKLPVTIISRCQKFSFKRITKEVILNRLRYIVEKEHLKIEDKGLDLIAKLSDGGMRDSLSLLEQVKGINMNEDITYNDVLNLLGITSSNDVIRVSKSVLTNNALEALQVIDELDTKGKDLLIYSKELLKIFRHILMCKTLKANAKEVIPLANETIKMLFDISKITTQDTLIKGIRILQETETLMQNSSEVRISLELALIKISSLANAYKNSNANANTNTNTTITNTNTNATTTNTNTNANTNATTNTNTNATNTNSNNTTSSNNSNTTSNANTTSNNNTTNDSNNNSNNSNIDKNEKKLIANKLAVTKKKIISAFLNASSWKTTGIALENSKMKLNFNNDTIVIKIIPDKADKNLLLDRLPKIKSGFISISKINNIEVEIF